MRGEIRILVRYSQMRIGVCRKLDNAGSGEALEAILNRSYAALPTPSAFPTFLAFPALITALAIRISSTETLSGVAGKRRACAVARS